MSKRGGYEILAAEISAGAETEVPRRVVTRDLENHQKRERTGFSREPQRTCRQQAGRGKRGPPARLSFLSTKEAYNNKLKKRKLKLP